MPASVLHVPRPREAVTLEEGDHSGRAVLPGPLGASSIPFSPVLTIKKVSRHRLEMSPGWG